MLEENGHVQYSDGDIVIMKNVAELSKGKAYLFEMVIMMFCTKGKAQMHINDKEYHVEKDDIVIIPPKSVVEDIMVSPDIESFAIALSYSAMQHSINMNKNIWDLRMFLMQNPVLRLEHMSREVGEAYYNLLSVKLRNSGSTFHKEIMHALFEALFYELVGVIQPMMEVRPSDDSVTQGDLLCKRFIELLNKTEGRERSVTKFADQLCVTPKYLSCVTKASTDKTALEWIHLYAIEAIKRQLKFTDKSIKEIADYMNFPNLSFFGKFVRTHTGMSPTEFRRNMFANGE